MIMLNIFVSIVLQSITKEEGENLLPKNVGPMQVRMQGSTYILHRKSARRGLDLHMELVDATKEQLLSDCIDSGIFDRVVNASQRELLEQRRFLDFIKSRHKETKMRSDSVLFFDIDSVNLGDYGSILSPRKDDALAKGLQEELLARQPSEQYYQM